MPARGGTYQGMNWIWGPTRYAIYYRDRDPETGHFRCVWCTSRVWVHGVEVVEASGLPRPPPPRAPGRQPQAVQPRHVLHPVQQPLRRQALGGARRHARGHRARTRGDVPLLD